MEQSQSVYSICVHPTQTTAHNTLSKLAWVSTLHKTIKERVELKQVGKVQSNKNQKSTIYDVDYFEMRVGILAQASTLRWNISNKIFAWASTLQYSTRHKNELNWLAKISVSLASTQTCRPASTCHGDICQGKILSGDICPYQQNLSCYWINFDQTLKVGSLSHL